MTTPTVLTRIARRASRPGAARAPRVQRGAVISIRYAGRDEDAAIERLAVLSERPVPLGSALVAEVDGELWAALPLATGTLLVDPFHPSSEVEQLLTLRAAQLAAA